MKLENLRLVINHETLHVTELETALTVPWFPRPSSARTKSNEANEQTDKSEQDRACSSLDFDL